MVVPVLVQVVQARDVPRVKENVQKGLYGNPPLLKLFPHHQLRGDSSPSPLDLKPGSIPT